MSKGRWFSALCFHSEQPAGHFTVGRAREASRAIKSVHFRDSRAARSDLTSPVMSSNMLGTSHACLATSGKTGFHQFRQGEGKKDQQLSKAASRCNVFQMKAGHTVGPVCLRVGPSKYALHSEQRGAVPLFCKTWKSTQQNFSLRCMNIC